MRSDFPKFINKSAKEDEKNAAANQLKLQADKEAKKLKTEMSKNSKSSIYAFFNKNWFNSNFNLCNIIYSYDINQ